MMDWKDTVVKKRWMSKEVASSQTALLLEQAEISFKAGMEEESTQAYHVGLYDGILRGRREVVDYFFYEVGIVALMGCSTMEECKSKLPGWQDKLKDWGL